MKVQFGDKIKKVCSKVMLRSIFCESINVLQIKMLSLHDDQKINIKQRFILKYLCYIKDEPGIIAYIQGFLKYEIPI